MTKHQVVQTLPQGISPKDAASYLGVSKRFVYDLAAKGEVSYHRIGRRIVFHESDLMEYLQQCRVDAKKPLIAGTLRLTASCRAFGETELEKAFCKLGVTPKLAPLAGTRRQVVKGRGSVASLHPVANLAG